MNFPIVWIPIEITGFPPKKLSSRIMVNVTTPSELELNSAGSFSKTVPKNRDRKSLSWVKEQN